MEYNFENINDIIDSCLEEYKKRIEDGTIAEEELKDNIINQVKIKIQEEYKVDMFDNPSKKDLKRLEKAIDERIETILDKTYELENIEIAEQLNDASLKKYEKEIKKINNLESNGNHKSATRRSGKLIRNVKKEIRNARNKGDLSPEENSILEQLENILDNQLEWHKNELANRYKNEFSKKPATVKAIITVLPHGVGLQAKRVVNCINQLKEAKTNKEKVFKIIEIGKEIGLLALTPAIFTVKFIVKHWYLLLLLLLLLRLPGFNFEWEKKPKPELDPEPEYEYEVENEFEHGYQPGQVPVGSIENEPENGLVPGLQPNPALDPLKNPFLKPGFGFSEQFINPVTGKPYQIPEAGYVQPNVHTNPVPDVDIVTSADPINQQPVTPGSPELQPKPTLDPLKNPFLKPDFGFSEQFINPATGKPYQIPEAGYVQPNVHTNPVPDVDIVTGADPIVNPLDIDAVSGADPISHPVNTVVDIPEVVTPEVVTPEDIVSQINVTPEEHGALSELVEKFIDSLEQHHHFVILSRHPEITIVHNAEEFLEAAHEINPTVRIDDPEFFYTHNVVGTATEGFRKPIIWPELDHELLFTDEQALLEYVKSGKDPDLADYFEREMTRDTRPLIDKLGDLYSSSAYAQFMQSIGISGGLSLLLFGLYEGLQYGVVPELAPVLPY